MKVKLTETQYKTLLSYINEAVTPPAPTKISGLFSSNKSTAYFSIVKIMQKTKAESEYLFSYKLNKGYHEVEDVNKGTATKGCKTIVPNLDMLIVDTTFEIFFTSCQKSFKINDVVGIRLFDENHTKLDEMTFENSSTGDVGEKVDFYNDDLKSLNIGDEVKFKTDKREYDGEVINKNSETIEIELQEPNKKKTILLYVNIDNDGFYEENGEIFFKSTQKDIKTGAETEFKIPIKAFFTNNSTKQSGKPEVNDPNNPADGNTDADGNPKSKSWMSAEEEAELKAQIQGAYDAIKNDRKMQKVFYNPDNIGWWNYVAQGIDDLPQSLKNIVDKNTDGEGLITVLDIVDKYQTKQVDLKLHGDFIDDQQVTFSPYKKPVHVYINGDKNSKPIQTFELKSETKAKVKPFNHLKDEYRTLVHGGSNYSFNVEIKEPTEVENVFLCNIVRQVTTGSSQKVGRADDVYLWFDPSSPGYKPIQNNDTNDEENN